MNTFMDTLGYFGFIFLELIILFLSISAIVSLVLQYIPKERLNSYLSRKGPTGYFLAAALGSITPFCACSTI
ncbi:MAG: permease, partial [Victivallaceae bacterium]|nr:permease [Victivallaceae bacterium]